MERRPLGALYSIPRPTGRLPLSKYRSTKKQSNFYPMAFGAEGRDGETLLCLDIHMSLSNCGLGWWDWWWRLSGKWNHWMSREDGHRYPGEFSNVLISLQHSTVLNCITLGSLLSTSRPCQIKTMKRETFGILCRKQIRQSAITGLTGLYGKGKDLIFSALIWLEDKVSFEYAMTCSRRTCRKSSMIQPVSVLLIYPS